MESKTGRGGAPYDVSLRLNGRGVEEFQDASNSLRPRQLVVLAAFHTFVMQVFAQAPALLQQDVAELLDVGHDPRSFFRTDVEPDRWAGRGRSWLNGTKSENRAALELWRTKRRGGSKLHHHPPVP